MNPHNENSIELSYGFPTPRVEREDAAAACRWLSQVAGEQFNTLGGVDRALALAAAQRYGELAHTLETRPSLARELTDSDLELIEHALIARACQEL